MKTKLIKLPKTQVPSKFGKDQKSFSQLKRSNVRGYVHRSPKHMFRGYAELELQHVIYSSNLAQPILMHTKINTNVMYIYVGWPCAFSSPFLQVIFLELPGHQLKDKLILKLHRIQHIIHQVFLHSLCTDFYNSEQIPHILISSVIIIKCLSKGMYAFNTETDTKGYSI